MYRRIIEELMRIEASADVNALRAGGLRIWPLARFRIARALQYGALDVAGGPPSRRDPLKRVAKVIAEARTGASQLRGLSPVDAVVLEAPDFSREKTDRGNFDKTADSMLELLTGEGFRAVKLGTTPARHAEEAYPVIRLSPLLDNLKLRLCGPRRPEGLEGLRSAVRELTGGKAELGPDFLDEDLRAVRLYEALYLRAFRRLRPRAVFVSTYYANPQAMGAILAARAVGAVSVDVQHGSQGPDHEMYSHWTRLPEEGYELLPDFFWNWGEESAAHIRNLRPDGYRRHLPLVGGNLWLAKCARGELSSPLVREAVPFFEVLRKHEKVVLFAMQPIQDCLPANVLEAMKRSPPDWIWLVRLHPQMKDEAGAIRAMIEGAGLRNFEMEFSTELPLFHVLSRADHLVTIFSSSVTEAVVLGIPATLTASVGRDHYPALIKAGQAVFAESPDAILASIRSGKKGPKGTPYMELSPGVARAALARIMRSGA